MKTTFKKALCLLLTLCLISGTVFTLIAFADDTAAPAEIAPGDVNGDGTIDTADVIKLRQYFAYYDYDNGTCSIELSAGADVNGDGKVNLADLYALRIRLAEKDEDETEELDTSIIETDAPETDAPETDAPETSAPETSAPETSETETETETETEKEVETEYVQNDGVFDAYDIMGAYNSGSYGNFKGELVTEDGVTFFRATATAQNQGTLVLNSGANTIAGVGKYFVVVYRNKTNAITRFQLGLNSAGKTNNVGGASPFYSISKTNTWTAVYFNTSNSVDLTNGAGYISIDLFSKNSNGTVVTQVGDVMEIALIAMVDSKDTAQNMVGEYCGKFMSFSYLVNIPGVYAYSTEYKGSDVLPAGQQQLNKPIEMDLSTLPISGNLTNALRLGAGWAITRGGWDYYECKITSSDGVTKTIRIDEGNNNLGSGTLGALKDFDYGDNKGLGGSLFNKIAIDLTGFEGKTVTLQVYGISNYGMSYNIANIKNVYIAGVDNTFTAQDFFVAYKNTSNAAAAYNGELITENGITFFRATATVAGNGRITLNSGSTAVENFGKSYLVVYRNNSASTSQKLQFYITSATSGATGTMIPSFVKANTSEWKVAVLNYSNTLDMSAGAKAINLDLFYNNGAVGDVVDIALFIGAEDEASAWEIFAENLGDKIALPYMSNIDGVVVNGTTYKDSTVLPNGNSAGNSPIQVDLSSVNMPAISNLTNCFKLGQGWAITRGGWDYYLCKITTEGGRTETIRISEGSDFPEESNTLKSLLNDHSATHGSDLAIGGNIFAPIYMYVNLTGFEGEKVTLDIIGVSNYGMEYSLMNIKNVKVPGTAQYNIDDEFVSFVDYTKTSNRKAVDIKDGTTYAVSFTVPSGEQVNLIRANLTNENALNNCSINVSVYSFDGNYASSVATTPLYTKTYTSVIKSADLEVKLGAGNYVMVVKYVTASGSVFSTVMTDNAWSASTIPEEYAKYNMVSYKNGAVDASNTVYGGILVETVGAVVPADDVINATFADTDAKVIVIAGQSNAAGTTLNSYLKNNVTSEQYAKYQNGFPNVKIYFTCGSGSSGVTYNNVVEEFVEVKIGQGYITSTFGPELALAEYLAENFPDQQFYIIKYAIGGTAMDVHWNALDENKRQCLNELEDKVDSGLELLKAQGLNPKIVGFFWMQGEGDANPASRTAPYYNYQKALMSELRERYADYAVDGDIPFIDTEINNDGFWAASYMINDAKNDIAEESGRNYIIDSNYYGLTTRYENNDLAHYDSTSMILLGQLYARKLCAIYNIFS